MKKKRLKPILTMLILTHRCKNKGGNYDIGEIKFIFNNDLDSIISTKDINQKKDNEDKESFDACYKDIKEVLKEKDGETKK